MATGKSLSQQAIITIFWKCILAVFVLTLAVACSCGAKAGGSVSSPTSTSNPTTTTNPTGPSNPTGSSNGAKFFSPTSFINTPLPSNPSVDPNSATMVANSFGALKQFAHFSDQSYGTALVYSNSSDKVYAVACTIYSTASCAAPGGTINFPIPQGVTVPAGTDHDLVVVYPAEDGSPYAGMELGCWVAQYNATNDTWSCGSASILKNTNGWGTCAEADIIGYHCNGGLSASGFAGSAGAIKPEEIAAGVIPHALIISLNITGTGIICPATHSDHSGDGIPEGAHFFLPANWVDSTGKNVDQQSWPSWVKIIAHALQTYGGYQIDFSGNFEMKGFTDQNPGIGSGSVTWASVGVPTDAGAFPGGNGDLSMLPWTDMQIETMQSCN
jgi:hypothetical protein